MKQRREAIQDEINKTNQGGGPRFFYVDVGKLERLGISQYKSQAGDNFIRIIPPKDPSQFYGKEVFVHYNVGADGLVFLCLRKMYGEPCPVCEYREELKKANPEDEAAQELAPSRRYLFFVFNVASSDTEEEGLHWFDAPVIVKDNIVSLSKDKRTGEIIDVSDPEDGRDVEFVRVGTSRKTRYEGFKLVESDPIPESWYKDVPDFDEVLLKPDYDQVKREVRGAHRVTEEKDSEDAVEDEPVAETRTRRARRSREDDETSEDSTEKSVQKKIQEIRARRRKSDD